MADMIEFEIGGVAYQARRLDLLTQLAIVTKLGPLMASGLAQILQLFDSVTEELGTVPSESRAMLAIAHILAPPKGKLIERLAPLMGELAKMPQDDQQFILAHTLSVVQRNAGSASTPRWETIWPLGLPTPALAEFRSDLMLTLRVVGTVLGMTLGPFIPGNR